MPHSMPCVVEEEDQEQESRRLEEEEMERRDMEQLFDGMDRTWEQRKTQEQEQAVKKRRHSEGEEQQKLKRRRRLKYSLIQEDWGAMESIVEEPGGEQDHGETELVSHVINIPRPPLKSGGSRCSKKSKDSVFTILSVEN